ncbi:NADH dehydrogenase [ubiquinone] 1 beta subcomplex subunit 3 [Culicoides brevitarsis]|uniref:NADH dehydrogenase [ubiquinone] 1 beta subcomplex subunit 3 n=1 Tax=Culicoides brevitarsis TaxID=469753 RepID=UPI00307B2015
MGGHHEVKIPDWRSYKVENAPQLMEVKEALARQGLKDPWLRNEVWRHDVKQFSTQGKRFALCFVRGAPIGIAAFLITLGIEKAFNIPWAGSRPGHEHHHEHH